jgi:hypothetical protein
MMQGWIPAFAESTPRIEKKYSGGNDEAQRRSTLRLVRGRLDIFLASLVMRLSPLAVR